MDFDFSYPKSVQTRKLSEAYKTEDYSQVTVQVGHFQGRGTVIEVPGEERGIWIPKATLSISETDSSVDYDCLSLTDWKIALAIAEIARSKSKQVDLIVKPFEVKLYDAEPPRRLVLVLDLVT